MTHADAATPVGHILGPLPGWMPLGEPQTIDGVEVREVLADWSHLPECDRPPGFVMEAAGLVSFQLGWDVGPDRAPVKCTLPGKSIADLAGRHSGACAILFNGGSLADHDLNAIKVPIIGMNRTHAGFPGYTGPQPDYLCLVDWAWLDHPAWAASVRTHPCIINGSTHHANIGYRVLRHPRMSPFAFDLGRDGFVGPVPCTTGYLALQLAAHLGFTRVYCLGLDMGGPHFDGTRASIYFRDAIRHLRRIAQATAGRLEILLCGSPASKCDAFPHAPFSSLVAEVAAEAVTPPVVPEGEEGPTPLPPPSFSEVA